jgi:RNA polymerase sigma factor (sigma-70 family)
MRLDLSLTPQEMQAELEGALKALAESSGEELAGQIRPVLFTNLDRGRLQNFTDGDVTLVAEYVRLVADRFTEMNGFVRRLQSQRDVEAWGPLFERMQTWAYNFFLRKNFAADRNTQEIAAECATDAAVTLLNAHFPYDTGFDPWAHILVQNACRKYIHKAFKKSAIPAEKKVELQDNLVDPDELLLEGLALQKEAGSEIASLLAGLSEARRAVIEYIYFQEMEPEEVAKKMDKSVGAIYSLQFHALRDLRKILNPIRDNINE